jgi:hypothetical protein
MKLQIKKLKKFEIIFENKIDKYASLYGIKVINFVTAR